MVRRCIWCVGTVCEFVCANDYVFHRSTHALVVVIRASDVSALTCVWGIATVG
jgi:hypothetical protein